MWEKSILLPLQKGTSSMQSSRLQRAAPLPSPAGAPLGSAMAQARLKAAHPGSPLRLEVDGGIMFRDHV